MGGVPLGREQTVIRRWETRRSRRAIGGSGVVISGAACHLVGRPASHDAALWGPVEESCPRRRRDPASVTPRSAIRSFVSTLRSRRALTASGGHCPPVVVV